MYNVIENFIPDSYSDVLLAEIEKIEWKFTPSASNVGNNYDRNNPNIQDSIQYVHGVTGYNDPPSSLYSLVVPLVWFFEKETNIKIKNILRIKINCLTRDGTESKYNPPHVDVTQPGFLSLIYYVNDSDGDTVIFDKSHKDGHNNLTPIGRITPKKGTATLIPSDIFHSSSCPINTLRRMVVNIILQPEEF